MILQRLQVQVEQLPEREQRARVTFMLLVGNLLLRRRDLLALPAAAAGEP